ncbi:uroporphyrinogen-III synthase [Sanguibacter sp. 25GB23B1]|uniref:uroporphyrinogen-III synthase n=1 Tax=unclassified Sanguibacter TaxID=2645534 RepID=UPI0032AFE3CF
MISSSPTSRLDGVRVLIPRAPGRGEGLAARIEAAGGTAIVAPLISRADADGPDLAAVHDAVEALRAGAYGWVAITSVNAVSALVAAASLAPSRPSGAPAGPPPTDAPADAPAGLGLSSRPRAVEGPISGQVPELDDGSGSSSTGDDSAAPAHRAGSLSGWPVRWAAVGPATARALRRAGVEPELVAAENSAVGMLAEWPVAQVPTPSTRTSSGSGPHASTSTSRVLLPLGDLAEPTLEHGLAERGYTPVRITAYRTVSHPAPPGVVADWTAGRIHLVVLTSGSVAREVARQLGPRPDVLAVAIGQPTRRAAEGTGQRVAAVASGATDDALFSAIIDAADLLPTMPPLHTTLPEDQ